MTDSNSLSASPLQVAEQYLVDLYGEDPQGLLWIGGHADGFRGRTFRRPSDAARYAIELDAKGQAGVYHRSTTLARVPDKRGEAADSAAAYYFALDVDVLGPGHKATELPVCLADAVTLIERACFPMPTSWVESGGGYYPQWRFTEPIEIKDTETFEWVAESFAMMSAHFIETARGLGWKLDNVRDLARVFRMPGTTNRKTDVHTLCLPMAGSGERHDMGLLASLARPSRGVVHIPVEKPVDGPVEFDSAGRTFTRAQATEFIRAERRKLAAATSGFNNAINAFAMACAHFPWLVDREQCGRLVIRSLGESQGWTAPDADDIATINSAYSATEAGKSWTATEAPEGVDTSARSDIGLPRLQITGSADMTYWLAQEIGKERLAGFFLRDGRLVHTPRVNEIGYVPGPDGGDNGPAEIRPVTPDEVAAKIQFLYACFKVTKEDGDKAAMFPAESAKRVVNAPEAATGLRSLRGITLTPMVRADGSLLTEPGYDKDSGYLFLPAPGVAVPAVSSAPTDEEVTTARELLLEMVAGFPFVGDDDRANYLGALLTPLLRPICPPPYKMIGIGAHQPGSGKTLLAQTISIVHGGVLRSEVPEDEAEWRKMTMSLLATTSAPVAVLDNVTGVLKSSVLAGLLTAQGEIQDRELGSSRMIRTENDRLWVITGNNLSLGGDLVRRTVTVMIDPDMANPETRTGFAIQDLAGWVTENRNRILHALLTLVQNWVHRGSMLADRAQSDGYARWEKTVAGILSVAGVSGSFDDDSGKRAARGGDDDGLAHVLEILRDRFGDRTWSVAEALSADADHGDFIVERSRDWLPAVIVDKIERSPAAGRISFGRWLQFRDGRWVRTMDGRNLVIRPAPHENKVARWRIEER